MGCLCCALGSFVSVLLDALERISLCTVCCMLTCCLMFTIIAVMVLGVGIGFHYCFVQNSVDAMARAAEAAGALKSGTASRRAGIMHGNEGRHVMRSVNKAIRRGVGHRLSRREAGSPPDKNNKTLDIDQIETFYLDGNNKTLDVAHRSRRAAVSESDTNNKTLDIDKMESLYLDTNNKSLDIDKIESLYSDTNNKTLDIFHRLLRLAADSTPDTYNKTLGIDKIDSFYLDTNNKTLDIDKIESLYSDTNNKTLDIFHRLLQRAADSIPDTYNKTQGIDKIDSLYLDTNNKSLDIDTIKSLDLDTKNKTSEIAQFEFLNLEQNKVKNSLFRFREKLLKFITHMANSTVRFM